MSPQSGYGGKVEKWRITRIKMQRGKIIFGPYRCPSCYLETLMVKVDKREKKVSAACSCGFSQNLEFIPHFDPIDYYGRLVDNFHKKK
jgi:transcription elongation factor Elf1